MLRGLAAVVITGAMGTCTACPGIEWRNTDDASISIPLPDSGSDSSDVSSAGGSGTGGANTGGAATGGSSTGGANTGGASAGGAASGGASTGGSASGGAGGAGGAVGVVVFTGDFETGNLSQWAYIEQCRPERILVYDASTAPAGAPMPRQGRYAARFRVLDTDVSPCTSTENPRAEVETSEQLLRPGNDIWEFWSVYIPVDHATPRDGWFLFQEDYGAPWDGPPAIGWIYDFYSTPHQFRVDRGQGYEDQVAWYPMIKGRWADFLIHKKLANTNNGGGFIEAWIDGVAVRFGNVTRLMTRTMHTTQRTVGFYLSSYRSTGMFDLFDVYYDAVKIGTSREVVLP